MQDSEIIIKQKQFNEAMFNYDTKRRYKVFGRLVSIINICLQVYLLKLIYPFFSSGLLKHIAALAAAYLAADFINGVVHMYMDNNSDYTSIAGPLIASFHLHHKKPLYKKNSIPAVYFNETGSKVWLVFYLSLSVLVIHAGITGEFMSLVLVYTGILSSVAEVSHYLAHNEHSAGLDLARRAGLLLSTKFHARHHIKDNEGYTFLNGFTDPLVNLIASKIYKGYKNTTDLHYADYSGPGTENRV